MSSDTTQGWNTVEPAAAPWYDRMTIERAVIQAKERCAEWSYSNDAHGYCHERSVLVALIRAVETQP